jgi:hypothetical protein
MSNPLNPSPPAGRLYDREEFPSLANQGLGEIFRRYVFSIIDSLVCIEKNTLNLKIVIYLWPEEIKKEYRLLVVGSPY